MRHSIVHVLKTWTLKRSCVSAVWNLHFKDTINILVRCLEVKTARGVFVALNYDIGHSHGSVLSYLLTLILLVSCPVCILPPFFLRLFLSCCYNCMKKQRVDSWLPNVYNLQSNNKSLLLLLDCKLVERNYFYLHSTVNRWWGPSVKGKMLLIPTGSHRSNLIKWFYQLSIQFTTLQFNFSRWLII